MNVKITMTALAIAAALMLSGCGGDGSGSSQKQNQKQAKQQNESGLSDFELEHGIGPVTEEVSLGEVDMEMAQKGKELFEMKCSSCHKINERYIGPAMDDVLERRNATYVMNMILNPDGMVKEHPEAKKLMQEYMSPMPNQGSSKEEARAIVEYFASDLE